MHRHVTNSMRKTSLKRLRGYRVDDVAYIGDEQSDGEVFVHAPSTQYEADDEDKHRAEQNDQGRCCTVLVHLTDKHKAEQESQDRAGVEGERGVYSCHDGRSRMTIDPRNVGTKHVGFSPIRQVLLVPSAKLCEVLGESREG